MQIGIFEILSNCVNMADIDALWKNNFFSKWVDLISNLTHLKKNSNCVIIQSAL